MSQYFPTANARAVPDLSRSITPAECGEVVDFAGELGLENGWIQEMESKEYYLPDFESSDNPFERQ